MPVELTDAALDDLRRLGPTLARRAVEQIALLGADQQEPGQEPSRELGRELIAGSGYRTLVGGGGAWRVVFRVAQATVTVWAVWIDGVRSEGAAYAEALHRMQAADAPEAVEHAQLLERLGRLTGTVPVPRHRVREPVPDWLADALLDAGLAESPRADVDGRRDRLRPLEHPHRHLRTQTGLRRHPEPKCVPRDRFGTPGTQFRWSTTARAVGMGYLSSTVAPASSSCAFAFSASSLLTFSSTGFGAPSTRSLASLRPRPETIARTSLMTWIFLSPAAVRMTSNSSCSSAAALATTGGGSRGGDGDGSRGGDAELLLERLEEVVELEHGHALEDVEQLCGGCHDDLSPVALLGLGLGLGLRLRRARAASASALGLAARRPPVPRPRRGRRLRRASASAGASASAPRFGRCLLGGGLRCGSGAASPPATRWSMRAFTP